MVIMIISFRDITTTDYSDHADNKRKFRVSFLAQPNHHLEGIVIPKQAKVHTYEPNGLQIQ